MVEKGELYGSGESFMVTYPQKKSSECFHGNMEKPIDDRN